MGDDVTSYVAAPNLQVMAADGVEYAYRDVGPRDGRPLILLQHFRGNLDNWDPHLSTPLRFTAGLLRLITKA